VNAQNFQTVTHMAQKQTNEFCYFNTDQHLKSSLPLTVHWLKKYTKKILRLSQAFYIMVGQCSGVKVKSTEQLTLRSAAVSHIRILKDQK